MGNGTDAAANTREVTSFLVWTHKKGKKEKIEKEENPKKIEKEKIQKNRKRKIQKNRKKSEKGKSKKIKKKNQKEKEFVSSSSGQNMHLLSLPYS